MSRAIANASGGPAIANATPERVLASIIAGINAGDLESLMSLYERDAAFATQPGSLAPGAAGIDEAMNGEPVRLAARNADVLCRQTDGSWRFVIDNPWGVD